MPRHIPLEEILTILKSGDFRSLVGGLEDAHLECKGAPYRLLDDPEKMEFGKDLTALANADGGVILLGVTTQQDATFLGEAIRTCGRFSRDRADFTQYQKVAEEWIIPPIRGLSFEWHPDSTDNSKGIASIRVPADASADRPYIVCKTADSSRIAGSFVAYFERKRDNVPPMRAPEIRARLKDGLRFHELGPQIANLEATIANLITSHAPPPTELIFETELFPRVQAGRRAFNSQIVPTFSLAAWPLEPVQFKGLFQSNSDPVVRLLENPPIFAGAGFSIDPNKPSKIVEGKLRRSLADDFRMLEVWRDGFLLCLVQGDGGHLCWGTGRTGHVDMQINNIALADTVYEFCDWALQTYQHAEPQPKTIKIRGMLANMNPNKNSFALNNNVLNTWSFGLKGNPSLHPEGCHFEIETDTSTSAGVAAYRLLADLYVWFGFNADEIPYVDRTLTPPTLDLSQLRVR